MMQYYFTFQSLTQAQTALHHIGRRGISAALRRTPTDLSARGCGYSVSVPENTVRAAAATLNGMAIAYRGLYRTAADGSWEEVVP